MDSATQRYAHNITPTHHAPTDPRPGAEPSPLFATSRELWLMLLVKALAKLNGGRWVSVCCASHLNTMVVVSMVIMAEVLLLVVVMVLVDGDSDGKW